MGPDRLLRVQTRWATGGTKRPSRDRRFILIFLCFITIVSVSLSVKSSAARGQKIIARNDSIPLKLDFEKGRFGTGKLYFDDPLDLAVDEDNNVYVLDAGNYRVQVVNDKGRYKDQWGERGDEDGYFDEPVALAINSDSDFLVILDQGAFRIHKFEPDGTHLLSFGEEGRRKGDFERPVDVTIDTLDYVYVLDRGRGMILKFHDSGAFVGEWGDRGKPEERLEDPVSIAYSDELTGFIYVLDAGKMALLKYQRDGEFEEVINLVPDVLKDGMKPVKVEINNENEVFVLDGLNGKLIKLNGDEINVFQLTSDVQGVGQPSSMALDEDSRIYISDLKKNRIYRFLLELN